MKVKYVGPHASITVEVDKTVLEVERGEAFEVPDDEGKRLIEQDIWEQAGKAAPKTRAKKAARKAPAKKAARKAPAKKASPKVVETDEASASAEPTKED